MTSPPIEIRPAGLRDLPGVWQLERACFGHDAWGVLDLVLALTSGGVRLKAQSLVAGRRVAGFVMAESRAGSGLAWIATLGVHPEFQRQGIGARLLAAAEAGLESRLGACVVRLTVRETNASAIGLYRKYGYRPVDVWQRYYADGEGGIVMERRLD